MEPNSCNKLNVNFLLNAKFVELLARIILLRGFPRGSCHILLITPELKGRYSPKLYILPAEDLERLRYTHRHR